MAHLHVLTLPMRLEQGLAVKAIRGDALLFYSLLPNGKTDPTSLHGSCPTTKGDKYSATKWVRASPLWRVSVLRARARAD